MATRVTQREKEIIYQLYQKYGSMAAVAKKTGRCTSTVSKYVAEMAAAQGVAKLILQNI